MGAAVGGGRGRRGGIVGINVTPMVDVMLVLLVIMMVSATYIVSQALKVELPKSASTDETVTTVLQVTVTRDNKVYFNQQPVAGDADLTSRLAAARANAKEGEDVNLVVSADADAKHGSVVHVIDLAKQQGITKFAINVQSE
jgi:biopolymer transport protein ExbD